MSATIAPPDALEIHGPERRYDMPRAEREAVAAEYIARLNGTVQGRFIGVEIGADGPMADVARSVTGEVFYSEFGNDPAVMAGLYSDEAEANSRALLVIDTQPRNKFGIKREGAVPAGVIRYVDGAATDDLTLSVAANELQGMETHDGRVITSIEDLKQVHSIRPGDRVRDVTEFAILEEYRATALRGTAKVAGMLEYMLANTSERDEIVHIFSLIDVKAYEALRSVGVPFEPIAGIGHHFPFAGSRATFALYGRLDKFRSSVEEKYNQLRTSTWRERQARRWEQRRILSILRSPISDQRRLEVAGIASVGINNTDMSLEPSARRPNPTRRGSGLAA